MPLTTGALLRFDRTTGVVRLVVQEGAIWITTTPAEGDSIVQAGEALVVDGRWPVIAQALVPSEVRLFATS